MAMTNAKKESNFGWLDYWRMFLKRGIRLPLNYFLNAHLFDLIHKTDTHTWLPKELYVEQPLNFSSGALYMTSWSNEIRRSYHTLLKNNHLKEPYTFIDMGSGKGKVCLLWTLLEKNRKENTEIIGIDYYREFINIAEKNHTKMFGTKGRFIYGDATEFDFLKIKTPLIVYLYNPFNEIILEKVANNLPIQTIIIYNNPVYRQTLIKSGIELLYEHFGWHPNADTSIYIKTKPTQQQLST